MHPRLTSLLSQERRPRYYQRCNVQSWLGSGEQTFEQQPPKMSPTVTPQLSRAGKGAFLTALEKVNRASGSSSGFVVFGKGSTSIFFAPVGTCSMRVGLRRCVLLACADGLKLSIIRALLYEKPGSAMDLKQGKPLGQIQPIKSIDYIHIINSTQNQHKGV